MGVILHSTRGGAATPEQEFRATLKWFANPVSQVSAHAVIAIDGTIAHVVEPDLQAWHARSYNRSHLGVELTQPRQGDAIMDAQYRSLAWWLRQMNERYGFILNEDTLLEHWQIDPAKSDIGTPFSLSVLWPFVAE